MRQAIVTLKKGEGRLLKSGGAWIFDNEIDSIMGEFENGDIVIVHDFDGYGMGRGFINMNSKIRIRMMTRKQDQEIDLPVDWLYTMRLKEFICLAERFASEKSTIRRKRTRMRCFQDQMLRIIQHPRLSLRRRSP